MNISSDHLYPNANLKVPSNVENCTKHQFLDAIQNHVGRENWIWFLGFKTNQVAENKKDDCYYIGEVYVAVSGECTTVLPLGQETWCRQEPDTRQQPGDGSITDM